MKTKFKGWYINLFCIVFLIFCFDNLFTSLDNHSCECVQENCLRCIEINYAKENVRIIFKGNGITFFVLFNIIYECIKLFYENLFFNNLILMKVQFNE